MNVLVTGGLGYIGSHTIVELLDNGFNPIIVDNLSNSKIDVLDHIEKITNIRPKFYLQDVKDKEKMDKVFAENDIDGIIHFAAYKSVPYSIKEPVKYYNNNILTTLVLLELCEKYKVNKFVFSSSATVYGNQKSPVNENMPIMSSSNPYGETKIMNERILKDYAKANEDFCLTILRYFNPIGAHKSGMIGENVNEMSSNLMPYILKVASGQAENLLVYGDDYDTVDGSGIRDYIHVVDLAKGHVKVLENIQKGVSIYNLGTGKGTSVIELVDIFSKVNGVNVPYKIADRREGDIDISYADVSKIEKEIGWKAIYNLKDMVMDAWNYYNLNLY